MDTKIKQIASLFSHCTTQEEIYDQIIALGQQSKKEDFAHKEDQNLVVGCQSQLWLYTQQVGDKLHFSAHSEALISMGLAQLLVIYYSGEDLETILKSKPTFLNELQITNALSPSRTNGLYHVHLKMQQEALQRLVSKNKSA